MVYISLFFLKTNANLIISQTFSNIESNFLRKYFDNDLHYENRSHSFTDEQRQTLYRILNQYGKSNETMWNNQIFYNLSQISFPYFSTFTNFIPRFVLIGADGKIEPKEIAKSIYSQV